MPRKNGMTKAEFPKTPYAKGASIIDAEGDSMTEDSVDALRVIPVTDRGKLDGTRTDIVSVLDEQLVELKRIRVVSELQLGEGEVEVND